MEYQISILQLGSTFFFATSSYIFFHKYIRSYLLMREILTHLFFYFYNRCRRSGWPMCGPDCERAASKNPEVRKANWDRCSNNNQTVSALESTFTQIHFFGQVSNTKKGTERYHTRTVCTKSALYCTLYCIFSWGLQVKNSEHFMKHELNETKLYL